MAELKVSKPVAKPVTKPMAKPVAKTATKQVKSSIKNEAIKSEAVKKESVKSTTDTSSSVNSSVKPSTIWNKVIKFSTSLILFRLLATVVLSLGVIIMSSLLIIVIPILWLTSGIIFLLLNLKNIAHKTRTLLFVELIELIVNRIPNHKTKVNDTTGEESPRK